MAKKDSLKKHLQKGSLKKDLPSTEEIEKITEQVYNKEEETKKEVKEPKQRTTIDIPKSLHIAAKMEAMKDGISLKEFLLNLIRKELDKRNNIE